jgi:hypothetical protein
MAGGTCSGIVCLAGDHTGAMRLWLTRDNGGDKSPPLVWTPPAETDKACCCPARPVVSVVLPATAQRPHPTELLLCAHHYRVSRKKLDTLGASVHQLPGTPPDVAANLPADLGPVRSGPAGPL